MSDDAPLRVCHLGKYYPPAPGGIETHVRTLARAQARLGADVRVLCVNHADRRGRDVTWARYGATQTSDERDGLVRVTRLGRSATFARLDACPSLPRVIAEINQSPPDVLHLHTPNPTMVLAVANLLREDVTLVISHHSDIVRQRVLRWLHEPFERSVYARAAVVLTSSPMYAGGSATLRQYEEKVHALPLGIDVDSFADPNIAALAEAHRLRRALGPVIWLAAGRCVYYKGLHVAIDALARVRGTLLIVGHGPLVHELNARAEARGVRDRVVWRKHASDDELVGAYLAATALWFPSVARSEAFGLVQVEAMAAGCPVINTDIPDSGVAWVSVHGETGLTVPINDSPALARAAQLLLDEAALRERLSFGAVRRARSFDHTTMAERSLAVYRRALAQRNGAAAAPVHSRLREWVRRTADVAPAAGTVHSSAGAPAGFTHARLAPLRGEPVRRG